jgi:RNA polymerase sigma-70 factor (ECF subfamily)
MVAALLARLNPEHQTVMQLAYYQEMSIAEIARVMDSPEGTVKTRMFQARKRLAAMLAEAGLVADAA